MSPSPALNPLVDKIDSVMKNLGPDVLRDDDQAKGRMYKRGRRRVAAVRVREGHVSVHLHGLPRDEADPTGLLVARNKNHLRAEVRTYDEAGRLEPLLRRAYDQAGSGR